MKKIVTILSLALLLNASEETCYTVQLASASNSPNNLEIINNGNYPDNCRLMTIGNNIAMRCGCYDKLSTAGTSLFNLQKDYKEAIIIKTYKNRFDTKNKLKKDIVSPFKETPTILAAAPQEIINEEPVMQVTVEESVSENALTLNQAIEKLKSNNLEIQGATYDISAAKADEYIAEGNHWGKLDFIQDVARSNDAGNVFGFKLSSREASFGDFGFAEFSLPSTPEEGAALLATQPDDLNYPDDRNYFQSKLKYEVPLFAGFQISSYSEIMASMTKMKTLDKQQIINEKIYELRKSFYDMALIKSSTKNLKVILNNILKLEDMTKSMISVGYAKNVDLLEVKAKKGNVERLLGQMKSNEKLLYHYISFLLNEKVTEIRPPKTSVLMPKASNDEILKNNLDIQKASTGLEVRKSMVDVSQANYYPKVGAFAELSTADNSFLGNAADHRAYTVGARLTWNIFNGGIDESKLEKSQLEHLKTQTQVQLARAGIELQIQKIRTEIATYDEEIISLEKELTLANEIYINYEGRYKEKLTSMSNVIIKQSEQIEKILQLQMVKNKRNERIFALEKIANGEIHD